MMIPALPDNPVTPRPPFPLTRVDCAAIAYYLGVAGASCVKLDQAATPVIAETTALVQKLTRLQEWIDATSGPCSPPRCSPPPPKPAPANVLRSDFSQREVPRG